MFVISRCEGGFVQLVAGLDSVPRPRDAQVCGANERFAPPVIMFEDRGAATLIFQSVSVKYCKFKINNNDGALMLK